MDDKTLKIESVDSGDTLVVKQLGRNDGLLSESNSISLSQDKIAMNKK